MTGRSVAFLSCVILILGGQIACQHISGGSKSGGSEPTGDGAGEAKIMHFLRYEADGKTSYGILDGDEVRRIDGDLFGEWRPAGDVVALSDVKVLVPAQPTKVLALAGNYRDHLGDTPPPEHPEPFFKSPSCLLPHGGEIVLPTENVHYEAEMVIVIGKRASKVAEDRALDHVLGVTCGTDVSARDWQENDQQWWRAKASDTFGPCGPYIASGLDYQNLSMELRLNGEVRQKTNTKNQIHGVAHVVSFVSRYVTLEPGDLIFTGTPGETQPLSPGDVVEVEIEGVGVLKSTVAGR